MDWFRAIDSYCERTDPAYWSEPLNAVSNAAFLAAAAIAWRIAARAGDAAGRLLAALLALIGIGSYLFHTQAQLWSLFADVLPIQAFILVYLYLATRRFFGAPVWAALLATVAFVPASQAVSAAIGAVTGPLNGSVGYLPVPILLALFALALRRGAPQTARGLAIGTAILILSLTVRTLDTAVCSALPAGMHFLWHLLNAVMLGWMIRVLVRHRSLAPPRPAG